MNAFERAMKISAMLDRYRRAGFQLFPLRGKFPADKGWRTKNYALFDELIWLEQRRNVGFRLVANQLIIDADPRNYQLETDSLAMLCEAVGIDLRTAPATRTGSGGLHLFFLKPHDFRTRGHLPGFDGLDFLSVGKLIVAPDSIHPDTRQYYKPEGAPIEAIADAPDALLEMLRRPKREERTGRGGEITPDQLATLLNALDSTAYGSGEYDAWIALAAACHDATGGYGFEAWSTWCATDPDYEHEAAMERNELVWESFEAGREDGATYRTLYKAVRDAGRADLIAAIEAERAIDDFKPDALDLDAASPKKDFDFGE